MEIRNFRTMKKVVETGNFSKAAEALGYAQSTVTFHIQAIEDHYHQQLFNRTGKGVELTEFGKDLLEHIDELLNSYEAIESFSLSEKKPRSIRIGAPESLMMYRLYHIIKQYKQTYPNVEIVIMNDNCSQLRDRLNSGDLDLCFLLEPKYTYSHLQTVLLKKEEMCFVVPSDFEGDEFLPKSHQMVLYTEKDCSYREIFSSYLKSCDFYPTNILETGSVEAIKKYIQYGLGISYLPLYSVIEDERQNKLRIKRYDPEVTFYSQLIYQKNRWLSPTLDALIRLCIEHAKTW